MVKERKINEQINQLNQEGKAVVFIITGNNSAGKTALTLKLLKNLYFYQSINLGLASKIIRFFREDLAVNDLENFNGGKASDIFRRIVDFIAQSYQETGVNIIIDGVQIDTERLLESPNIIGGVILVVDEAIAVKRGENPETHFKRKISEKGLKNIEYFENRKFRKVNNNGNIERTYQETIDYLQKLLTEELQNG